MKTHLGEKNLLRLQQTKPSPPTLCELCEGEAPKNYFLQVVRLCQSCRNIILHIEKYEYVYGLGLEVKINRKGRIQIPHKSGFVECSKCKAYYTNKDFGRHICLKTLKTTKYKLITILKKIQTQQQKNKQ